MHPDIRKAFSDLLQGLPAPQRVIEIGQDRDHEALIDLPELAAAEEKVALGLNAGGARADIRYLVADANDLSVFGDGHFDLILCNSMLEHDRTFWRSLAEMRRVARCGGHMVIGVPGFGAMAGRRRRFARWCQGLLSGRKAEAMAASTPTLGLHGFPDDFYRFSKSAVQQVFLDGCEERTVIELLDPPRLIGVGRRGADRVVGL